MSTPAITTVEIEDSMDSNPQFPRGMFSLRSRSQNSNKVKVIVEV